VHADAAVLKRFPDQLMVVEVKLRQTLWRDVDEARGAA
jgi:hypothetical protein